MLQDAKWHDTTTSGITAANLWRPYAALVLCGYPLRLSICVRLHEKIHKKSVQDTSLSVEERTM